MKIDNHSFARKHRAIIEKELNNAIRKHPLFAKKFFRDGADLEDLIVAENEELEKIRNENERFERGKNPVMINILTEEILELGEALLKAEISHNKGSDRIAFSNLSLALIEAAQVCAVMRRIMILIECRKSEIRKSIEKEMMSK